MKTLRLFLLMFTFLIFEGAKAERHGEVNFEKGYYYVIIKSASFESVDNVLQNEIKNHKWGIIHTINVDKTVNSPIAHKTYLLCRSDYLEQGVKFNKDVVSVIIPCRISIYQDKNDVKILVEDVSAYNQIFGISDKRFRSFLNQVGEEMKSILQKTANEFGRKQNFPNM